MATMAAQARAGWPGSRVALSPTTNRSAAARWPPCPTRARSTSG